jgi:glycosyltransferase involved in cell wall biosynthesis
MIGSVDPTIRDQAAPRGSEPLLTIVTPILNRRGTLKAALESVDEGLGGRVEHLVVDGGSHDGSREVVLAHPGTCLIDAPGSTLYQAINIGLQHAQGNWIALLNSDDLFEPGALEAILPLLERSKADAVRGRAHYRWSNDSPDHTPAPPATGTLTLDTVLFGGPAINAIMIRRSTLDRIGAFDEQFAIAADREWLLRAQLWGWNVQHIDLALYRYTLHSGSLTLSQRASSASRWTSEHVAIARRYLRSWPRLSHEHVQLARWHAQETARLALQQARRYRIGAAAKELWIGFREDPVLPFSFFGALIAAVIRRRRKQ